MKKSKRLELDTEEIDTEAQEDKPDDVVPKSRNLPVKVNCKECGLNFSSNIELKVNQFLNL